MADRYYLTLIVEIFQTAVLKLNSIGFEKFVDILCEKHDVSAKVLLELIYRHASKDFGMFSLVRVKKFHILKAYYINLNQFPRTLDYLNRVVWVSGREHSWLPAPVGVELARLLRTMPTTASPIADKWRMSYTDINLALYRIVKWIHLNLPSNASYRKLDDLTKEIGEGSDLPQAMVTSLTGSKISDKHTPFMVKYDRGNLIIVLKYKTILRYSMPMAYLKQSVWKQKDVHKWLTPVDVPLSSINLKSSPAQDSVKVGLIEELPLPQPRPLSTDENAKRLTANFLP